MKSHHNKPYEGLFITIEGGDGAGKTTFAKKLCEELTQKGYRVAHTREPGGSPLAEKIRALLLDPQQKFCNTSELLLFLAARAEHLDKVIMPALRECSVVVCERFNDSSIAYQGMGRHLGMEHVEKLCSLATAKMTPDATFLLDIDPQEGLNRARKGRGQPLDRVELEKLQFHKEVRQAYLHLADLYADRIIVLDATEPVEQLLKKAFPLLEPHLLLKPCLAPPSKSL